MTVAGNRIGSLPPGTWTRSWPGTSPHTSIQVAELRVLDASSVAGEPLPVPSGSRLVSPRVLSASRNHCAKCVLQLSGVQFAERGQESPLAVVDEPPTALQYVAPFIGEADSVLAAVTRLGATHDPTFRLQLVDQRDHRRAVDSEKLCHFPLGAPVLLVHAVQRRPLLRADPDRLELGRGQLQEQQLCVFQQISQPGRRITIARSHRRSRLVVDGHTVNYTTS
jgi:hypothetical protein